MCYMTHKCNNEKIDVDMTRFWKIIKIDPNKSNNILRNV